LIKEAVDSGVLGTPGSNTAVNTATKAVDGFQFYEGNVSEENILADSFMKIRLKK
jgi:hypothetical protein